MKGPGQPGPAERAEALVREGRALFAVGDLAKARTCFDRAAALVPDHQAARSGRDRCDRLMAEGPSSDPEDTSDSDETPEVAEEGGGPAGRRAALLDDFPDADQQQEETVVDPMAALEVEEEIERERARQRKERAQEAPRPQPPAPAPPDERGGGSTPAPGPGPDSPSYPRYVAGAPGNYPEVIRGPNGPLPPAAGPGAAPAGPGAAPAGPPVAPAGAGGYVVDYPQVMAGQGYARYATPVGPHPGAGPPYRAAMLTPELRRRWIAIGAGAALASGLFGLLLGWAIFGGDAGESDDGGTTATASGGPPHAAGSAAPADAGCAPAAGSALRRASCGESPAGAGRPDAGQVAAGRPDASQAAATAGTRPQEPAADRAPGPIEIRAAGATHPVLATIEAPTAGRVSRIHSKSGATVPSGAHLFTVRGDKRHAGEQDVTAPAAGLIEPRVEQGSDVQRGQVLAVLIDPDHWRIVTDVPRAGIGLDWSCQVASRSDPTPTTCTVDSAQTLAADQTRVSLTVESGAASWMRGADQPLKVTLSPPAPINR